MGDAEIDALVASGDLVRGTPDRATAARELDAARAHLATAAQARESDPIGAFALGYDAIRKALAAHMRAAGLSVRTGGGHHLRVGRYAVAALDDHGVTDDLREYDTLRKLRNQSQYDGIAVEAWEVDDLLVHARAIVAAVGEDLA